MEKQERSMTVPFIPCDEKCVFDDKSTFGSSQNGQNMPKRGQQEKIFLCTLNKGQLHNLLM